MYIVTGAAGFIGSCMVWQLNQQGITDIICVDDFGSDQRWRNLNKLQFRDFVNKDDLMFFLDSLPDHDQVQAVFHLGANASTTERNMDSLMSTNYYYSQALFEWCNSHNVRFIYASSAATYGNGDKGFSDKTDANLLVPLNAYGYSKVLFDRWIAKQDNDCNWVGLKFFNVFGPQEYHKEAMASLVHKAYYQVKQHSSLELFKSHRPEFKDGEQKRDFIYVKDVCRWMWELYKKKKVTGFYNMGYGEARSWNDLAKAVFAALNKEVKIKYIDMPESIRNQYQYFTEADMSKWQKAGLSPAQWPLEKAVHDYIVNYLDSADPYL